jgi:hypothetical protein
VFARIDLTLDCADAERLARFWKTALGYVDEPPPPPFTTRAEWLASFDDEDDELGGAWLCHPSGRAPRLSILEVPEPKIVKNRLHFDLRVSPGERSEDHWANVETEVGRLVEAGAMVLQRVEGHHVVMGDPEGNEFCVA